MTAAQRLIDQGLAKGLAKGRSEGAAATLERLMALEFGPLDEELRGRLATGSPHELALWTERVLFAQSLDELVAD